MINFVLIFANLIDQKKSHLICSFYCWVSFFIGHWYFFENCSSSRLSSFSFEAFVFIWLGLSQISISRIFAYLISENDILLLLSQMCICLVVSLYLLIRLYFVFCESLVHPVFSFSLDSFKLWTNHPAFGVAKITFCLALGLGIILTIWLHLPYIPGLQKLPFFGWIGTVMSFCEGAL